MLPTDVPPTKSDRAAGSGVCTARPAPQLTRVICELATARPADIRRETIPWGSKALRSPQIELPNYRSSVQSFRPSISDKPGDIGRRPTGRNIIGIMLSSVPEGRRAPRIFCINSEAVISHIPTPTRTTSRKRFFKKKSASVLGTLRLCYHCGTSEVKL